MTWKSLLQGSSSSLGPKNNNEKQRTYFITFRFEAKPSLCYDILMTLHLITLNDRERTGLPMTRD